MKSFALLAATLALGFSLVTTDAEAGKRLGGGSSFGMQRQSVSPSKNTQNAAPTPAPSQAANHQAATPPAAPAAQPKRSWMGPLAGLAAGIGLAALASHFGFGEGMANFMMIGLLIMGALMLFKFLTRNKAAAQGAGGMQYAAATPAPVPTPVQQPASAQDYAPAQLSAAPQGSSASGTGFVPADFDADGFVRNAKVNFIRLQAANDAANFDDIREFTTPEMFAELKLQRAGQAAADEPTDIVSLNAEVLDVNEEPLRYIVSVRFTGTLRETRNGPLENFDEMWHLIKPREGNRGWVLAGIQQV